MIDLSSFLSALIARSVQAMALPDPGTPFSLETAYTYGREHPRVNRLPYTLRSTPGLHTLLIRYVGSDGPEI